MHTERYDDLAILECFDYRCGYCFDLLPVYGNVEIHRTRVAPMVPLSCVTEVCGSTRVYYGFHFDHLEPRANGGGDEWTNLVPCCLDCNRRKHASALPRWLFRQVDPGSKKRAAISAAYQPTKRARDAARAERCAKASEQDFETLLRASLKSA